MQDPGINPTELAAGTGLYDEEYRPPHYLKILRATRFGRNECKAAGGLFIQMNTGKAASDTESRSEPAAATLGVIVAPAIR